ncbi:MAG: tRNA uridine-5-carboxymethylaminomethyl(34) synthesis GTPase MnmE [Bacilli bacterium]
MGDTIVAVSTALAEGAITIIRISGNKAISIVNSVFKEKDLTLLASHTINYGHIVYNGEIIDEVLLMLMRSPKTYTTEDIIEINCHGSIAIANKILEILLILGCRLAEPGEFTKRAFLNGRIDLIQAEGVMDLINSKTELKRKLAINEVSGTVSTKIKSLRQKVLELIANIEVNIDYPEYEDIEIVTINKIKTEINLIKEEVKNILNLSENGKIIKDGIKTLILGKPNVGKSSLLNTLLEEEKAIVTSLEGTTRDVVEGSFIIDGVKLDIIDTAGVRDSDNVIEKIGIDKSIKLIDEAELILLVLNYNQILSKEDKFLLEKTKNKRRIIIINKIDLDKELTVDLVGEEVVKISTKNNVGLDLLKIKIKELFNFGAFESKDLTFLTNARQISALKLVLKSIEDIEKAIKDNLEIDMIEIDLRSMWEQLGEIIGTNYSDELIDQLFSQFCLGK